MKGEEKGERLRNVRLRTRATHRNHPNRRCKTRKKEEETNNPPTLQFQSSPARKQTRLPHPLFPPPPRRENSPLDATEDAIGDADQYLIIAVPRAVHERPHRLHDRHEEAAEADGPEASGQGPDHAPEHTGGAAPGRVRRGEPPRADGPGDGHVGGVLYHLMGEEVRQ